MNMWLALIGTELHFKSDANKEETEHIQMLQTVSDEPNKTRNRCGSETVKPQCQGMERMALVSPLLPTALFPASHFLFTYSLTPSVNKRVRASSSRMSVFDHLAPLSASSRQTQEHPSVCLSPPLSLSSPIIKKKAIQIPSFDEKGLVYDKHNTKQTATDRSFVPICSPNTSSQSAWSKPCQRIHGERASTLPRAKPKVYSSPILSAKPSISIFPAPKPNSSPTPSTLKPKPSDSLHLPASQLSDLAPLLHQLLPKPSVSPTLTVPTPRLSPSPTSLCQGMSSDGQGGKHPSPVARERRARSITISNANVEVKQSFSNELKHDILDQEALMDFTHPELRRSCPRTTSREPRHQTHFFSDSKKQAATSLSPCLLQGRVGLSKTEYASKDKPKPPLRNLDLSAIPKPNIKQQQECVPSGATGTQTLLSESEGIKSVDAVHKAQSAFDGLATQRKCTDIPQNRYYSQTAGFVYNKKTYEQMCTERNAALPVAPKMSFSTEPHLSQSTVSPNIETRRRRFDLRSEAKVDTTFLSGFNPRRPKEENITHTITGNSSPTQTGVSQHTKSPQKHRFWSKSHSQPTQMDVHGTVSQSDCFSKDYSCQSRDIDQKMDGPQRTHRLNRLKTCLVAPQTQEASHSTPVECAASQTGNNHDQPPRQNKNHKQAKVSDTLLNQTDIFAAPGSHSAPTQLLEYPTEKCAVSWPPSAARCPLNTDNTDIGSKGVFDLPSKPQRRVCQRQEETTLTTASTPPKQVDYSLSKRAFIMEEPEDPYYVTMYYPGSVYVGEYRDMQTTWNLDLNSGKSTNSSECTRQGLFHLLFFFPSLFFNLFKVGAE